MAVLRTGEAARAARDGRDFYAGTYATEDSVRAFQRDMTALSIGSARAIAERFPWDRYRTLVDVGCAEGALPAWLLRRHPHLTAVGFDLPPARMVSGVHGPPRRGRPRRVLGRRLLPRPTALG